LSAEFLCVAQPTSSTMIQSSASF